VAERACSKMGCAAARRNAPKQPRAIRAGPQYLGFIEFFGPQYRGFIEFFPNTGGLSDFLIPGVYRIFGPIPGVYRISTKNPGVYLRVQRY